MTPKPASPTPIELAHLKPPPEPWGRLATLGSIYLLGDVEQLGASYVVDYLQDHPLIAVKTGRKEHIVVGQYRSWELVRTFSKIKPNLVATVPAYIKQVSPTAIPSIAAENLFMEGLISSLSPEYAIAQLSNLWKQLPESSRQRILPAVRTQADFANILAYDSRTGFDPRRLNRLNRPPAEKDSVAPVEPPPHGDAAEGSPDVSA